MPASLAPLGMMHRGRAIEPSRRTEDASRSEAFSKLEGGYCRIGSKPALSATGGLQRDPCLIAGIAPTNPLHNSCFLIHNSPDG
jgi:hypothetical protein